LTKTGHRGGAARAEIVADARERLRIARFYRGNSRTRARTRAPRGAVDNVSAVAASLR
jgi:hypothetical protein